MARLKSVSATALMLAGLATGLAAPAAAMPLSTLGASGKAQISKQGDSLATKVAGCHQSGQYHMVFRWGYPAWHRHRPNCRPVAVRHCHRGFRHHFHPGYGNVWHKHVGPNCVPFRGQVWQGGPRHGCVKIGGLWICG